MHPVYKSINRNLLGKSIKGLPEETLTFNLKMLYDFNMGYYKPKDMTPHSSVGYFKEEHQFYHPWSIESSGKMYGYNRLKEILPLKDFMTLPAGIVDELMFAVQKGEEERFELEKTRDPEPKEPGLSKEQAALLKEMGLKS